MEKFTYRPQNVCPVAISFDLDGDTVHNISFSGGCSGNLKAISKLLEGKTVDAETSPPRAPTSLQER